jgi:hypothetical protein
MIIRKNKTREIATSSLFSLWEKYRTKFFLEVVCPYCKEITSICRNDINHLHLGCSCIIPKNPTLLSIEIKIARIKNRKKGIKNERK